MRGRTKTPKTLVISGAVYLEAINQLEIEQAKSGDIVLSVEVEALSFDIEQGLSNKGYKGYFRMKIYDGKIWAYLNANEFFTHKENHFSKNEYPINCFEHCQELLQQFTGKMVYRTYRDHYTLYQYVPNEFKGKKGNKYKKAD